MTALSNALVSNQFRASGTTDLEEVCITNEFILVLILNPCGVVNDCLADSL